MLQPPIKKLIPRAARNLEDLLIGNIKHHLFGINVSQLPGIAQFNTNRYAGSTGQMFRTLDGIRDNPVIYWFEAADHRTAVLFIEALDNYRIDTATRTETYKNRDCLRVIPAPNKNRDKGSNVIYVGKSLPGYVEKHGLSDVAGRIMVHLGYYGVPTTQGLQLVRWANQLPYTLTLNIIEIFTPQEDVRKNLKLLELLFASQFNPLCGQH